MQQPPICQAVIAEEVNSHIADHIFDPRMYKQENSPDNAHRMVSEPIQKAYDLTELRKKLEEKMVLHGVTTNTHFGEEENWPSYHSTPSQDEDESAGSNVQNESGSDDGERANSMGMASGLNEDFAFRPGTPPLRIH